MEKQIKVDSQHAEALQQYADELSIPLKEAFKSAVMDFFVVSRAVRNTPVGHPIVVGVKLTEQKAAMLDYSMMTYISPPLLEKVKE